MMKFPSDTENPTLENLMKRIKALPDDQAYKMRFIYAEVAGGVRDPIKKPLMKNLQILACQTMVILISEVLDDDITKKIHKELQDL